MNIVFGWILVADIKSEWGLQFTLHTDDKKKKIEGMPM